MNTKRLIKAYIQVERLSSNDAWALRACTCENLAKTAQVFTSKDSSVCREEKRVARCQYCRAHSDLATSAENLNYSEKRR